MTNILSSLCPRLYSIHIKYSIHTKLLISMVIYLLNIVKICKLFIFYNAMEKTF